LLAISKHTKSLVFQEFFIIATKFRLLHREMQLLNETTYIISINLRLIFVFNCIMHDCET